MIELSTTFYAQLSAISEQKCCVAINLQTEKSKRPSQVKPCSHMPDIMIKNIGQTSVIIQPVTIDTMVNNNGLLLNIGLNFVV